MANCARFKHVMLQFMSTIHFCIKFTILTIMLNVSYLFKREKYDERINNISQQKFSTKFKKNIKFNPSLFSYFWIMIQGIFYFLKSINELLLNQTVPNHIVHSVIINSTKSNNTVDFKLNENIDLYSIIDPNKLTILNIGSCT